MSDSHEIELLRAAVRALYEPACTELGNGCEELERQHGAVIDRALQPPQPTAAPPTEIPGHQYGSSVSSVQPTSGGGGNGGVVGVWRHVNYGNVGGVGGGSGSDTNEVGDHYLLRAILDELRAMRAVTR
jgi:hypothetical protein